MSSLWTPVIQELPQGAGFLWIYDQDQGVNLAYYNDYAPDSFGAKRGNQWQTAESAGDYEGLDVEYYRQVTHWMPLQTPEAPA